MASNPSNGQHASEALSFNTPVADPEGQQCGRITFVDPHVKPTVGAGGGDDSDPEKPYPTGCRTNDMTPQQKAVSFLFFDLSGCVQPDAVAPVLP